MEARKFDLILVNRILDRDHSDGLAVIHHARTSGTPVMMITNYAEHQQRAQDAGAEHGFGKAELHRPETMKRLAGFLDPTHESEE